jgi:hypothetical protein
MLSFLPYFHVFATGMNINSSFLDVLNGGVLSVSISQTSLSYVSILCVLCCRNFSHFCCQVSQTDEVSKAMNCTNTSRYEYNPRC